MEKKKNGEVHASWNIHPWRFDFVKMLEPQSINPLIVRLIGWQGSSQTTGKHAKYLDTMVKNGRGMMVFPDISFFDHLQAEIGTAVGESFFPFIQSSILDIHKEIIMNIPPEWIALTHEYNWNSLFATYTYYENTGGKSR
jgi:hypothetical protein